MFVIMTKSFVQHFVENLLKVWKVWKTVSLTNWAPVNVNVKNPQNKRHAYGKSAENPKFAVQTLNFRHLKYKIKEKEVNTMSIACYILDESKNVKVSEYFRVGEFACKDGSQPVFIDSYLVTILDILRAKIGRPVIINSGYRTPAQNAKVGGAKYSYHTRGMAADIRADGMTAKELANKLDAIVPNGCGIIVYKNWVHFDVRYKKYRKGV